MNIITKLRLTIRRIRRFFIIRTAENYYQRMAQKCVELHQATGLHHYIIIDPISGRKIIITNRVNFRAIKRAINDSGARMLGIYGEGQFTNNTMYDIHKGCFYSSLLEQQLHKAEEDPRVMPNEIRKIRIDIEARRRAYIRWTIRHADKGRRKRLRNRREERIIRRELESYKKGNK